MIAFKNLSEQASSLFPRESVPAMYWRRIDVLARLKALHFGLKVFSSCTFPYDAGDQSKPGQDGAQQYRFSDELKPQQFRTDGC